MRRAIAMAALAAAIGLPPVAPARADDWSLTRPGRGERAKPARGPSSKRKSTGAVAAASAETERSEVLRQRYLNMLLRDPAHAFARGRLLALYRERDGGLDGLLSELTTRRQTADSYALAMLVGHVQQARNAADQARAAYQRAAELSPERAAPWLAMSQLAAAPEVAGLLEQALARSHKREEKVEIIRALAEHALDSEQFEAAAERYEELAKLVRGSVYQAAAHARALAARNHHARAVEAYRKAIDGLRGDNRVLPPLLLEQARAQLALQPADIEGALATLKRARKLAGPAAGVRYEIDEVMLEAYRRAGRLVELADSLEREAGQRFESQELLGRVHEELGDHDAALAAFRRALRLRPRDVDTQLHVVQILSRQGKLKEAIVAYQALVRTAPREPRFVVELAQLLLESGRRDEALSLLARTGRRFPRDARVHRGLFELYSRWEERQRARAELELLARIEPDDPSHLMALGEQHLEGGNRAAALATWRRMLRMGGDRARAHASLATTYLDHDMPERALSEFQAAVQLEPENLQYLRGLAETLERLARFGDAASRWQEVLALSGNDRVQRREARRRIVRMWRQTGLLDDKVEEFEMAFGWSPSGPVGSGPKQPDVEAGRFLAECYHSLGQGRRRRRDPRFLRAAEQVLARVIELAPGDVESMLALERLRSLAGNAEGAIAVLELLVEADPKNARGYLSRMAQHALSLYRDEDALAYAKRSVALNPDDGSAHERLGELYRARQQLDAAIASYTRAVELKPHSHSNHFILAELHLARGNSDEADRLLRQVMRASADDELVKRAARGLLQQHLGTERLGALEQELLPLALGHAQRPVYRRMLVELYEVLSRPWLARARSEDSGASSEARQQLAALGRRAIKPLLEALADDDPSQRRVAIDILGNLDNDHAALPLLRLAESEADTSLRRQALIAAGALQVEALAPRFAAIAKLPERRLWDAAAWALSRLSGGLALKELRALLTHAAADVRAYAALGLGYQRDRASLPALREVMHRDRSTEVRAAAALALGLIGDESATSALASVLRSSGARLASASAVALGIAGRPDAAQALAEAVFAPEPGLRRAALWALARLTAPSLDGERPLPGYPSGPVRAEALVAPWLALATPSAGEVVLAMQEVLRSAAEAALRGPPESAAVALHLLGPESSLATNGDDASLQELRDSLLGVLVPLVDRPETSLRKAAVALLSRLSHAEAARAVVAALDDREERVQLAVLAALGQAHAEIGFAAVATVARDDHRWWVRLPAVEALGRMRHPGSARELAAVLARDPYAYVREAAARALSRVGGEVGRAALARAAKDDDEARVRAAARRALRE